MPETRFVDTPDGLRIAYDVQGSGPPLVLLHGLSGNRMRWHSYGVVADLQDDYTVITLDFRGCGHSDTSDNAADYSAELHMQDVLSVVDALGFDAFKVWGWSFGATVASHLAAYSERVQRVVMAGTFFGEVFSAAWLQQQLNTWEPLAQAKADGNLHELSDVARPFVEKTDFNVFFARLYGLAQWPPIWPEDLRAPTVAYTGSLDGRVVTTLEAQRARILAAGHQVYVMQGFNHVQLIMETHIVIPTVKTFLLD